MPQYYMFNLSHAVVSPTLVAEDDPGLRQNYRRAYDILRRASAHHRNAYFNLVRILEAPGNGYVKPAKPTRVSLSWAIR
jgi:hypothetical protein